MKCCKEWIFFSCFCFCTTYPSISATWTKSIYNFLEFVTIAVPDDTMKGICA